MLTMQPCDGRGEYVQVRLCCEGLWTLTDVPEGVAAMIGCLCAETVDNGVGSPCWGPVW